MWVLVKYMDGSNKSVEIDKLSKLTPVENFRELVSKEINVPANRIRFFYRGKEVVDAYEDVDGNSKKATLFDYDVQNTNTVQLMLTPDPKDFKPEKKFKDDSSTCTSSPIENFAANNVKENLDSSSTTLEPAMSRYFKVGDLIDAKNFEIQGAWMEAKIVGISRKISLSPSSSTCRTKGSPTKSAGNVEEKNILSSINNPDSNLPGDDLVYTVEFEDNVRSDVTLKSVRPRARKKVPFDNAHIGKKIMVNYNTEYPEKVGFYYDFQVMDVKKTRTKKTVIGTIFLGPDETPVHECTIRYIDDMYEIEKTLPILARDESQKKLMMLGPPEKRMKKPDCDACLDKPNVTCKYCSCFECGGKDEPEKQLLCEECARYFHLWCLDPALEDIPEEPEWFCPYCKNNDDIVKPGQRMKSKKKDKMPSSKEGITRDWGRGMACAGRTKECTIVEKNHFGPVPGLEVGMCWEYRVMAAEAGAHRPQVAGIHGRESEGAYSIVLSGGYEDDVDEGDQFTYTGSGGRDLSGNKRTAAQSSDQLLTKMNKALALNCAARLNSKEGAEALNWKDGKPVRVLRGHKGRKYSRYCPEVGVRYDGIYKVVKYWPERGRSGFIVWRYLLMRDDTIPAPWTEEGKKRIEELGIKMEMLKQANTPQSPLDRLKKGKTAKKRKNTESIQDDDLDLDGESPQTKKFKACAFQPPKIIEVLIEQDSANEKIWTECKTFFEQGELAFKNKLKETFNCVICQELVAHPVTLNCSHTLCQKCLARSFKSEVYQCPTCRFQLGNDFKPVINEALREILRNLFRWYDVDRG